MIIAMVPVWFLHLNGSQYLAIGTFHTIPIFHGTKDAVSQLIMTYAVVRMLWVKTLLPKNTIWLMGVTILVWFFAILGGIAVYVISYIIQ